MITWTSERSGRASTGVCFTDQSPQAVSMTVNSSTRKRLPTDQRMMAGIMIGLLSHGAQKVKSGCWQSRE
ncbi:hypothetical protein D3C76_287330 [compost metagenome]